MEPAYWIDRWVGNEIGFHQPDINPYLQRYWPRLQAPAGTVFVPLCGKSRDMLWLSEQGQAVLGVEISPLAIQAFFTENGLSVERMACPPFTQYRSASVTLLEGDFFALTHDHLTGVTAVYDRASLIALPPSLRRSYAAQMAALLPGGTPVLLVTLEYPAGEMDGPPFAVDAREVSALFEPAFRVEDLGGHDILDQMPAFRERGLSRLIERAYVLRRA